MALSTHPLPDYPMLERGQAVVTLLARTGKVHAFVLGLPAIPADLDYRPEATVFMVQRESDTHIWPMLAIAIEPVGHSDSIRFSVDPTQLPWVEAVLQSGGVLFDNGDGTAVFLTLAEVREALADFIRRATSYLASQS